MDLIVKNPHLALWGDKRLRCAVGRNGLIVAQDKREGDGKTPIGRWPMRDVFYRPDRYEKPPTALPIHILSPDDGWCEIADDPNYNKRVKHPYPVGVDPLWREDHVYDVIVPLGYNDGPIVPGKGSAIFLHIARPDYSPSAGCVTLNPEDLLMVLREADKNSCVHIGLT